MVRGTRRLGAVSPRAVAHHGADSIAFHRGTRSSVLLSPRAAVHAVSVRASFLDRATRRVQSSPLRAAEGEIFIFFVLVSFACSSPTFVCVYSSTRSSPNLQDVTWAVTAQS